MEKRWGEKKGLRKVGYRGKKGAWEGNRKVPEKKCKCQRYRASRRCLRGREPGGEGLTKKNSPPAKERVRRYPHINKRKRNITSRDKKAL